jgi:cardiolipin synthase A/B
MKLNKLWGHIFALVAACGFLLFDGCALKMGKQPRQEIAPLYSARAPEFRQAAGSLLGANFVPGNNITTLVNGNQIFPAMLGAIRSARYSINFETYTFWDGEIAYQFTEALAERAQAGVKVNAILDAQGTQKMGMQNLQRLRDAGVEVVKYHSAFWPDPRRYNNRSHRKLLIEKPLSPAGSGLPMNGPAMPSRRSIGAIIITELPGRWWHNSRRPSRPTG